MGKTKAYEGEGVVVHFEARRCIHAAACVGNLPAVFDSSRRPWIDPKAATAQAVADVVQMCPSGALTYERTDGGPAEAVPVQHAITVVKDGPLYIRGSVEVTDHEGNSVSVQPRMALCRCGASGNKPFCDNSHVAAGFKG